MSNSASKNRSEPQPQPSWKAFIKPLNACAVIACLVVGGLAFHSTQSGNDAVEEDISDEDVLLGFQPKPLGAVGVSDSAAASDENAPPQLEFPAAERSGLATSASTPGPLFGKPLSNFGPTPNTDSDQVTAASFERQLATQASASEERSAPGTPRVVANQPARLTGTIEFLPEK